MQRFFDFFHI